MVRALRAAVPPLVIAMILAAAGGALGRVYAGALLAQLVAGAALGSVAVSVAARRLPSWVVAPLSVVALAGYAAGALQLAAARAGVDGSFAGQLGDAARNGIPRLLTAMIPIEPTPDTVLVPVVATWLAGLAGTELAVRSGRTLAGYGPPILAYAGALYAVGPNAAPAVRPTVAVVAAATLGLAATGRPADAAIIDLPPVVRTALRVRAVLAVAAVVLLAAAVAPFVADRVTATPIDPRQYVRPPRLDSLDENPLVRISGWALDPKQRLFDLDSDSGGELRIRLAVLADFDGVTWRVRATYRNAGRVLPPAPTTPGVSVDTVVQRITVDDLDGRLLPAVPTPSRVDGLRVAYDPATGTLIHPDGLRAGQQYTIESRRERPDLNLLTTADVPAGDAYAPVLTLAPGTPDELRALADRIAGDSGGGPYQRALGIEEYLAGHYRLVADAPSGHAYPNLTFFLFGPPNGGGRKGTSEQFAAAYAVLGRLMGLPTRVVVGFRSATGRGTVRGGDALAWPEVLFDGVGWVPFDPLPKPDTAPEPADELDKPQPDEPTPSPSEAPQPTPAPAPSTVVAAPTSSAPTDDTPVVVVLAISAAALILAGPLAILLARRSLRHRRLTRGSPTERVAGAWLEVGDALRLAGRSAPAHLSATELAAHAAAIRSALPTLEPLVDLVNRNTFAAHPAHEAEAAAAARTATAYAGGLRAGQPWWRRLLWPIHPGPLRRRH
jgi:transglutaminase-like putative cysteine protease